MNGIEKRRHSRIPVSVPISCISIDAGGTHLNFNMGVVKDVSQSGMALEVLSEVTSDHMVLTFIAMDNQTLEINGKVMHSRKTPTGAVMVGVSLLGTPAENLEFVKHLVRFHHYTKRISPAVQ